MNIRRYIFWLKCLAFLPVGMVFMLNRKKLIYELRKWESTVPSMPYKSDFVCFVRMFAMYPEYRSLFFFRVGDIGYLLSHLMPHLSSLQFITPSEKIGKGLVFVHGYSTILFPESIGENCMIWHNVTIGRARDNGPRPRIGNNVRVCAGSILIGDITVGDNAVIGAGSVVVKDVPANSVVCGNPARVVKQN